MLDFFSQERQTEIYGAEQFHNGKIDVLKNAIADGLTTFEAIKATGRYTEKELEDISAS